MKIIKFLNSDFGLWLLTMALVVFIIVAFGYKTGAF